MTIGTTRARTLVSAAVMALAATLSASPSRSEVLTFLADLDGKHGEKASGSPATGWARIEIDTASRHVSVEMSLEGITVERLWDTLVAAPIGPIHFHKYASPAGGASVLVLPLPYGDDYHARPTGLRVSMRRFDYGARAGLMKPALPFEDFVAALRSGLVVLNVHTDAYNPGEIAGMVLEAGAPRATRPVLNGGAGAGAGHAHAEDGAVQPE